MGRDFDTRDVKTGVSVAIINEDLAATMWPGQNPVGQRLQTREGRRSGPWLEVVAVVGNTATASSNAEDRRFVFVPLEQEYRDQVLLVVRGSGPGSAVAQTVRLSLSSTLPDVPLFDVRSMRDEIAVETRAFRVAAIGLSMLGVLALLLALVGLYGVMAYGVGQRTREFGVRQALGATAVDLYRLAAGEGLQMLAKGAVVGSLVALTLPWAIPFFLVGVRPLFDWVVVLAVPPALVLVGVLACLIPVRRAARLTPTVALRDL
jgi:ABC-type antimicrobial peptide transport system permease subunit